MKYSLTSLFLVVIHLTFAQLSDDFTDGDFSNNPAWVGSDTIFNVDNNQLRLNATVAGDAYLTSTFANSTLDDKEWRIWVKQSFSPSSNNNSRVYLAVDNNDLNNGALNGYYLQIGEAGSGDAVRLMYENSGVSSEICAGIGGEIATSFEIGIKVTRDNSGNWSLFVDPTGADNYVFASSGVEASITATDRMGLFCMYTVGNITKFYFDDIYFGAPIVDLTPPEIIGFTVVDQNNLDLQFNEALDQISAETTSNYTANNSLGNPVLVSIDGTDASLVHLNFSTSFQNGVLNTINVTNIEDIENNSGNDDTTFMYFVPENPISGDVIITEFVCDPSPTVGMKNAEFVEIYNRSNKIFDTDDWKIGDASSNGNIGSFVLNPGEFLILTSNSNVDSFAVSNVIGVSSFPSLNNSGDNIVLRTSTLVNLDSLTYTDAWYQDVDKEDGGWSIELKNPNDPCSSDDNWIGSNDILGGTPGLENSVWDITPDTEEPEIISCVALDENFIELKFSEGMDSIALKDNFISFAPALTIADRYVLKRYTDEMIINVSAPIEPAITYNISITNGQDCWGNGQDLFSFFVLPEPADSFDLVINELIFNPVTGSQDFVELYNRSNKYINLKDYNLANLEDDTVANYKVITDENWVLAPDSYVVLTTDTASVKSVYMNAQPGTFIEMYSMPTFSNEDGTVVLVNNFFRIMDQFTYDHEMHLSIIDDEDGKSLERLDPNRATQDEGNWHTAAEQVGFATPGLKNSQFLQSAGAGTINLTPPLFSPDSDGIDDNLNIDYQMDEVGFVANVSIYDAQGRLIKELLNNELLGIKGTYTWDGTNDNGEKARVGSYIILFKVHHPGNGNKVMFKKVCVVASKQ